MFAYAKPKKRTYIEAFGTSHNKFNFFPKLKQIEEEEINLSQILDKLEIKDNNTNIERFELISTYIFSKVFNQIKYIL
jgi:hypothetical protein